MTVFLFIFPCIYKNFWFRRYYNVSFHNTVISRWVLPFISMQLVSLSFFICALKSNLSDSTIYYCCLSVGIWGSGSQTWMGIYITSKVFRMQISAPPPSISDSVDCGSTSEFAFLTSSLLVMMLVVQMPHFENWPSVCIFVHPFISILFYICLFKNIYS